MNHPLFVLAVCFSCGIFTGRFIKIPFILTYILAVVLLIFLLFTHKKKNLFYIFLLCLVFVLGITFLKNTQNFPSFYIYKYICKNKTPCIVKGSTINEPQMKMNGTSFILKAEEIAFDNLAYTCCANILVRIKGKVDLNYADELILKGKLFKISNLYPKRKSYYNYLYNQDIYLTMEIKDQNCVVKTGKDKGFFLKRFSLKLKKNLQGLISRYVSAVPASILEAMILGEKKNIPEIIYNSMIKSGTVHILPRLYTKMPSFAL